MHLGGSGDLQQQQYKLQLYQLQEAPTQSTRLCLDHTDQHCANNDYHHIHQQ